MSLDVWLSGPSETAPCACPRCGNDHVATREPELFSSNITHNLNRMAEAAGIYEALWRPEEIGVAKAHQLIPLLTEGLAKLKADPAHYETFNAANGWGLYVHFVPFVEEYLDACKSYPDADVRVSR